MSGDAWTSIAEHDGLDDGEVRGRPPAGRRRKPTDEPHQHVMDSRHSDNRGDLSADDIARLAPMLDASIFDGVEVPEREWHVESYIPRKTVTILSGDGGTGKSTLAMQLAVCTVLGRPWLGMPVEKGPVIYVAAEDDLDELHRRFAAIVDDLGLSFGHLVGAGLQIIPLAECEDALLAVPNRAGNLEPTPRFHALMKRVEDVRPSLSILDTKADLFGGDELKRGHARQFIGMLRSPSIRLSYTTLLLDHPSASGLARGTGDSGSLGWGNSVRSRLYFERIKDEDGTEADPDVRRLATMKANYAQKGLELRVRWERGVFVPVPAQGTAAYGAQAAADYAEEIFLKMMAALTAEGRPPTPAGPQYAPTMFARDPRAEGLSKRVMEAAMNRLYAKGQIRVEETGPPSKRRKHVILVSTLPRK